MGEERPSGRADPRVRAVRFAAFELDVRAGELRKHGVRIRLQEQPFQVLLMLLERPGEVVLREEIRKKLWPNDTIVEFAPSINAAIQRLRDALGDSADQPRYVETVARRGYRFIGELAREEQPPEAQPPAVEESILDASDLTGRTVSHYRVYEKLGRGGMGEVYRARDTKLGRDVALKVLPEEFAQDADPMARFEREAQILASLNHPNIAAIYGVEEANGIRALVMEVVEGPTLAERIARGSSGLEEGLAIARQMADALEAAHEKGIVHRDLKPANVKVTPQGVVKVLDFGLATVMQRSQASLDEPKNSPACTATLSQAGVILGTAAYMAPEQARGEAVDKRADIWAFGVVLYEMLMGRRLFEGETTTEILSSVLTKEPAWEQAPAKVQRLLRRCLEKDPKSRLRDIGEVPFLLEDLPPIREVGHGRLIAALTIALVGALLALVILYSRRASVEQRLVKFSILPPEKARFNQPNVLSVSPDGRHLAFVAALDGGNSLWVREMDSPVSRRLPGTENAFAPFWSPDSHFIAFFASGKLKKIDVAGGSPQSLCDTEGGFGSWSKSGVIVFGQLGENKGLLKVPELGGAVSSLTSVDSGLGEGAHLFPWFLPDGRHFLYTAINDDYQEKSAVYVADLESKIRRLILLSASNALYTSPGYLLFLSNRTLMAQPFDAGKGQTSGEPAAIAEQVQKYWGGYPSGEFTASQNGVLAYSSEAEDNFQPTWFDRSGKAVGTVGPPGISHYPEVSPDGNFVAVDRVDPGTGFSDIWLHDLKRGTASRLTFNSKDNESPEWSPDGRYIVFDSNRDGVKDLYQKEVGSAAAEQVIDKGLRRDKMPNDWSRDGRYIIELVFDPKTGSDIWVLPLFGDRKAFPYLQTKFDENLAKLSPNGRWLAYNSDETGRPEIYVQNFPVPGGKWQVSTNGGDLPTWSRDGKELFFHGARPGSAEYRGNQGRTLMVAEIKEGAKFEAGIPKPLFDMPNEGFFFDVSPDGRFIIPVPLQQAASRPITVVLNWTAGLKK